VNPHPFVLSEVEARSTTAEQTPFDKLRTNEGL